MNKILILLILVILPSVIFSQGKYFFVFIDGKSNDTLTKVSIKLPKDSKARISQEEKVYAFSKFKKKHTYSVLYDNYLERSLNRFDFPKKNDTTKIFLVPNKETLEKRWELLQKKSEQPSKNDTLIFLNQTEFKNWLYERTEVSFSSVVHCNYIQLHISMEIHFEITDNGILRNGTPRYKYSSELTCKYFERDLKKIIWRIPIIKIENYDNNELVIPITIVV